MMGRLIVAVLCLVCLTACGQPASGAILVLQPGGGAPTVKATLSAAATDADAAGKTVVVTSALSAVQSNISSATLHAWPADRTLRRERGGTIGNTTRFRIADGASVDFPGEMPVFIGTGAVQFGKGVVDAIKVVWFGTLDSTGTTNNTTIFQKAIDTALMDIDTVVHRIQMPEGTYNVDDGLVIVKKSTGNHFGQSQFEIFGAGGGAHPATEGRNTTLKRTSAGSIFRICEESDGTYPGGGAGVVTRPLDYQRRVYFHDFDMYGDSANPNNVDAIVGRFDRSNFENMSLRYFRDGIRAGKRLATSTEVSADAIELDYCEQIVVSRVNMRQVDMMVHMLNGDIAKIDHCYLTQANTTGGRIFYFAGGNDFYYITNNIIHPYVYGGTTALTKAIELSSVRGIYGRGNHVEGLSGKFVYGGNVEILDWQDNLMTGTVQSSVNIFDITVAQYGIVNVTNNIIAMPAPSTDFMAAVVISDDGSYTKLRTCQIRLKPNKVTTTLGGATTYGIYTSPDIAEYARYGAAVNPGRSTDYHEWYSTGDDKKRIIYGSAPASDSDGRIAGEDALVNSTFSFPGVTVNAGAWGTVAISVTSANLDRFIQIAPAVSLGGMSYSVHPTSSSNANIVFYNPTGGNITLAAGTWKYKVELD